MSEIVPAIWMLGLAYAMLRTTIVTYTITTAGGFAAPVQRKGRRS